MINRRKAWMILVASLALIVGLIMVSDWFFTAKVAIRASSSEAQIFVKQSPEEFKQIGKGQAVFKTKDLSSLYVEIRDGDAATQTATTPKRRSTTSVSLDLRPLRSARAIGPGPFINPYIEGDYIYGINPNTNSLDVKSISGNNESLPRLPMLPFLRQVVWENSNNFIYVTATRGTGQESSDLALRGQNFPYSAAVKSSKESTLLLGGDGLYKTQGFTIKSAQKVISYPKNTAPFLFADERYVFFGWVEFEQVNEHGGGRFSLSPEHEEDDPGIKSVRLLVLEHDSRQIHDFSLPIKEQVFKVVSVNSSSFMILSSGGLYIVGAGDKKVHGAEFAFGEVKDMVRFNNRLLLLGERGMWEYDRSKNVHYKVADYPAGEEYVARSLTPTGEGVIFSSSLSAEELRKASPGTRSRVYKLDL